MKAVLEGDVASMQTILQQKQVLIYAHSKDGENIWHAAAQGGHPEVSQSQLLLLVVMYAEQQQTTVQLACGPTMLITIIVDNRGAARMWVCLSACCQLHNSGQQQACRSVRVCSCVHNSRKQQPRGYVGLAWQVVLGS